MADLFRRVTSNSLVAGSLLHNQWFHNVQLARPNAGTTSDGFLDGVQLVSTLQGSTSTHYFCPPPGCTSVRVTFSASEPSAQKSITLRATLVGGADVSLYRPGLLATATPITWTITGLTPLGTYQMTIEVNETGQSAVPTIGPITMQPIGATGLFSADFTRISIDESVLGPTANDSTTLAGRHILHESLAECLIDMPAGGSLTVESWGTNITPTAVAVLVNGRPLAGGQISTVDGMYLDAFNVPAGLITVRSGATRTNNNPALGNFLRAVYVPTSALARTVDAPAGKTMVILGDSIACGYLATIPALQGWSSGVRSRYPGNVLLDSYGIRSAFTDMNTAALRAVLALRLGRAVPSVLIIALAVNDYLSSLWTAAAFGTAYAAFLDQFHAVCPGCDVWCLTPFVETVETANGAGSTLGNYRTQITTAGNDPTRVPWAHVIDGIGSNMPLLADLNVDGIHPNNIGHSKAGQAIITVLAAAGAL